MVWKMRLGNALRMPSRNVPELPGFGNDVKCVGINSLDNRYMLNRRGFRKKENMLTEKPKMVSGSGPDVGPLPKKMILVARDYVHYLRIKERSKGAQEYAKVDGVTVPIPSMAQLLACLRDDLRCATTIFLEEFIECGGVECLLDVLRLNLFNQTQGTKAKAKQQQAALKRSVIEQHDCLLCLKYASKSTKTLKRLSDDPHGISSITSCVMSTATKTRILALELLCRVVESSTNGHTLILDALTANRVLYGEPLRFKFLVGMIFCGVSEKPEFQSIALKFLNAILRTSTKPSERVRLQCELEEAGFEIAALEAILRRQSVATTEPVWEEISSWKSSFLDMERVTGKQHNLQSENEKLQKEVHVLRKALQKLEEDKINLMQIEMELKEKCGDLHDEVTTLKTEMEQKELVPMNLPMDTMGRTSFIFEDEEDQFHSSIDSGHLETEEIFIDVPTIRPPIEFRGDASYDYQRNFNDDAPTEKAMVHRQNNGIKAGSTNSSDKESADSALSESESDSGLNWHYPQLPSDNTSVVRNGRLRVKSGIVGGMTIDSQNARRMQRSRSEDRTETNGGDFGDTKVGESTGFFMKRRPDFSTFKGPQHNGSMDNFSGVAPSYQLPVAYRSNFLNRGHSNCDLYSGVVTQEPTIPPPDYGNRSEFSVANSGGTISAMVHREITKAVRQISGWI